MTARILVVDDLLPNVKLLQAKLENEYYQVTTASSGIEALKCVKEALPDVILLDVMMPDMDGFETCRRLKKDPDTADIPVVMVTALSDVQDRVQGLNSGADDFLTKPINDLALFARIRSLVRLKGMNDELKVRDKTGKLLGETASAHELEVSESNVLIIDDDISQAQQIKAKLMEVDINVEISGKPLEAIELSEKKDFDLIMVSTQLASDDGLHLCTHIRSQEKTRITPLLIIIDDNEMDLLVKGLDMGINDYIISPVDGNEMLARVNIQVRRKRYQDALKANQTKSLQMAVVDGLTGLYNRHYFDNHLPNVIESSLAINKPLSLILFDIDHFKSVNDTHGHIAGDDVLRQLPGCINVRPADLVARYGGEEFVIVMPDTKVNQAADVAERIRKRVESHAFQLIEKGGTLKCSVSLGVTALSPEDTVKTFIGRADKALYHVKHSGRNRVAVYCEADKKTQQTSANAS